MNHLKLQLAYMSYIFPIGEIKNVLVKVNKFILLDDFAMIDIEEDKEVPLIMGKPFLATSRTIIDVVVGELIMRVYNNFVVIKYFEPSDYLDDIMDARQRINVKIQSVRVVLVLWQP